MFDFSITETLEELEGKTIQEKLQELDDLLCELENAANEVQNAKEEMEYAYTEGVRRTLLKSVVQLVKEEHLENVMHIQDALMGEKTLELTFDGHAYSLLPVCCMGDWELVIRLKDQVLQFQKEYDLLAQFADRCGLLYKHGNGDIRCRVDEAEMSSRIKEIALKCKSENNPSTHVR